MAESVKNPPAMQETWVQSLGWVDPLEEEMATHYNSCLGNPMDRQAWWVSGARHDLATKPPPCIYVIYTPRYFTPRYWRKVMTDLDSILKNRDTTLPTKFYIVKAMVFPLVTYACESWTVKKAEHWRIDAFKLWCWRRLLRVPWTARRSNQSILKEISPGC